VFWTYSVIVYYMCVVHIVEYMTTYSVFVYIILVLYMHMHIHTYDIHICMAMYS